MKMIRTSETSVNRNWQDDQITGPIAVDNDLVFEDTKDEGMYEHLQRKLGKPYLEIHKIIAAL